MQVTVKQRELHSKEANMTVDQLFAMMKEQGASDTYWKMLYEFSYACARGDAKAIRAELKKRGIKVRGAKLFVMRTKSRAKRFAKKIYHKIR